MNSKSAFAGIFLLAAAGATLCGAMARPAQNASPASHSAAKQPAKYAAAQSGDEGDRIFQQNCSRCHTAPEGFPPSISGTVIRHMRMRANLSAHEEQELLKYLNP